MEDSPTKTKFDVENVVQEILGTIEREREREIISRRFGLFDRRETLEQIGELLGITRERVRQLEKAVLSKLKAAAEKDLVHIQEVDRVLSQHLASMGKVARISDITAKVVPSSGKVDQARVAFLAQLAPGIAVIDDNDHFFHAIGLSAEHTEKAIRDQVNAIIDAIQKRGEP